MGCGSSKPAASEPAAAPAAAPAEAAEDPLDKTLAKPEVAEAAKEPTSSWRVKLGAEVPNFSCETTTGNIDFHEFLASVPDAPFTILFTHPKDFTPVCTTELGQCEKLSKDFLKKGMKLIGLSCDPVESHKEWSKDILHREQLTETTQLSFPIIADEKKDLVTMLGMLDPEEKDGAGLPLPARALILIGPDRKVKFSILYPATTGRNFVEVFRAIDSVLLTAVHSLATPANWKQGERCIVAPAVSMEDAKAKFQNLVVEQLPSEKPYLRVVDCPEIPTAPAAVAAAPAAAPAVATPGAWKVKLGAELPDFDCVTTKGDFKFHAFLGSDPNAPYTVLFSHPKDFTPVCTTEIGKCQSLKEEFSKRKVKLIGLSCDTVDEHKAWSKDILKREALEGEELAFPIIADEKKELVTMLGMLDPDEKDGAGLPLPARALILIDAAKKVRFSILYPATTGRNFDEVFRAIDSVLLTAEHSLATPANWKQGERCIVAPVVSMEDAEAKFQNLVVETLPSEKKYLRVVDCPEIPRAAAPEQQVAAADTASAPAAAGEQVEVKIQEPTTTEDCPAATDDSRVVTPAVQKTWCCGY